MSTAASARGTIGIAIGTAGIARRTAIGIAIGIARGTAIGIVIGTSDCYMHYYRECYRDC